MSETQVGMVGHAPTVVVTNLPPDALTPRAAAALRTPPIEPSRDIEINPEAAKYRTMWGEHAQYREVAPGEQWALSFLTQAQPSRDSEVIDFGAGTGRGGMQLALFGAMRVTMLDFAENCLDEDVANACVSQPERIKFRVADLTKPLQINSAYGYCCDVMEHIPPEDVTAVLRNILSSAQHCFFAISTVEDNLGSLIGERLHLTVKPMAWWLEQFRALGAVVVWVEERENCFALYCTAWRSPKDVVVSGKINVPIEVVEEQIRANILAGYDQVQPHLRQDRPVILLAGGPTMNDELPKIRELRAAGCALVTCNGAYQWAIDNGLDPSVQIVLDAREFNSRFVDAPHPTCRYLIASQCHPATLAKVPRERTKLWHSGLSPASEELLAKECGIYFPVPGGSTVVLRAIPLLRILGLTQFHVFGFDSCVAPGGAHHAYPQAENDNEPVVPVVVGGRAFECTPWQISQAVEFMDLVTFLGDEVELCVYGAGLIQHIVVTGASLSPLHQIEGT